jgi:hypothetical protein
MKLSRIKSKHFGAEEARRAHNPKVPGSKPGNANIVFVFFLQFCLALLHLST